MTDRSPPAALDEIVQSVVDRGGVKVNSRQHQLLVHLVEHESENPSRPPSQRRIAIDVFGRRSDFDPATDSIVRVEIGRLRNSLNAFYQNQGATDRDRLEIPKGSSRLGLVSQVPAPPDHPAPPEPPARVRDKSFRSGIGLGIVATLSLCALVGLVFWWVHPSHESIEEAALNKVGPPVIEVRPFRAEIAMADADYVPSGLQASIARGLSHFNTIRVRNVLPQDSAAKDHPIADYTLDGLLTGPVEAVTLELILTDTRSNTVIYATSLNATLGENSMARGVQSQIRELVVRIAAPGGIVTQQTLALLDRKDDEARIVGGPEYLCLLRWYAYDTTKSDELEPPVRACLGDFIAAGSRDGQIWAAHSFLTFLDWTKTGADIDHPLMHEAEEAAKLAVVYAPHNADGHEYYASILMAQGAQAAAREYYETALSLNPSKPDLLVLLGWQKALSGEWDEGTALVKDGVDLALTVPGWFRIPLALDAYRTDNFAQSLSEAEHILAAGDSRGRVLAAIAAHKLGDLEKSAIHLSILSDEGISAKSALDEIRAVFNDDAVIGLYEQELARMRVN